MGWGALLVAVAGGPDGADRLLVLVAPMGWGVHGSVLCVSTNVDMSGHKERRCGAARLRNLAASTCVDTMGQKKWRPGRL